jgi:multiple sugar transport system ATP-binding protein
VYERPRNMFVASFLGSPPINYLEGAIETEGGVPFFRRGGLRIALAARLLPATGTRSDVVLGIRPEDVTNPAASPDGAILRGIIDSVLPIGSDRFLGLKIEGLDVFVRVDKQSHHRQGESIAFDLAPDRLHVFDRTSGISLLADAVT